MKRRIGAGLLVLAGVTALGCDQPQPTAPTVTPPLFARATTTAVAATATLTIADSGKRWLSDDGIAHTRNQIQTGPVKGDITGNITVIGKADVKLATMSGTGSGKFTITAASGTWRGKFEGRFDRGVYSGKLVAHGSGAFQRLLLRGSIRQSSASRDYMLEATILHHGG